MVVNIIFNPVAIPSAWLFDCSRGLDSNILVQIVIENNARSEVTNYIVEGDSMGWTTMMTRLFEDSLGNWRNHYPLTKDTCENVTKGQQRW